MSAASIADSTNADTLDAALREFEEAKDTLLDLAAPSPATLAAEIADLREQVERIAAQRAAAAPLRHAGDQAHLFVRHAGITVRD
ncbi:hypothetical protein GXW78_20715 [Roseomonas terrae]|uniref:Uncharacterized protein n=1 Tax=Neoroseomonas terrae TaxID=424799 RepID=A0ABS5EM28_9PROT|nr:hypothetical protein [Neoroseomonas terrae]MBR0652091.1 hypothetical protein [Neoroseomonas terrae]